MLGDSLRRRRPDPKRREPRTSEPGGRSGWWRAFWPLTPLRWLLAAVIILLVSFGVGYLLSTQVLFPRPETAGRGVAVPELYGESRSEAESAIRGVGLTLGEVRELASEEAESGRVLAQDPVPGQQLLRGGTVSLAVSAGLPALRVPPVRGLGLATARELLEGVGFEVEVREVEESALPVGTVVRSDPPAGETRQIPSPVTLYVVSREAAEPGADDTVPDTGAP